MYSNKINRSAFSIGSLHDGGDEKEYWKSKTPQERMQAIEIMRKIIYGSASAQRLSRFFEITEFKKDRNNGLQPIVPRQEKRFMKNGREEK